MGWHRTGRAVMLGLEARGCSMADGAKISDPAVRSSEPTHGGGYAAGPHWSVQVWRRLGFYGRFDKSAFDWRQDVPAGGDLLTTDTTVRFSFLDRLRILLTGHVEVSVYTKTLDPCRSAGSRSEARVMP